MVNYSNSQVTVLLPCINESHRIGNTVRAFRAAGFRHIIVVDDSSRDETVRLAREAGAKVFCNNRTMGFNLTLLRGLYSVKTQMVLVISDPGVSVDALIMNDFLSLSAIGGYQLVLPFSHTKTGVNFSKLIKRTHGIYFTKQPGFQAVFIDHAMLEAIQEKVSGSSPYVYFEILKVALDKNFKIGLMDTGLRIINEYPTFHHRLFHPMKSNRGRKDYMKMVFPNLSHKELRRKMMTGILIAGLGGLLAAVLSNLFLAK